MLLQELLSYYYLSKITGNTYITNAAASAAIIIVIHVDILPWILHSFDHNILF